MPLTQTAPVSKQNPLLYWLTLAFVVGLPNFQHFDTTGRTASTGGSAKTFLYLAECLLAAYLLVVVLFLERKGVTRRRVHVALPLWLLLLAQFVLATLLQPSSRLTPGSPLETVVSLGLLFLWVTAFVLFLALYSRTSPGRGTELMMQLIGRTCWIWIGMVWCILPFMPGQAYGVSDDPAETVHRLGGQLIHPGQLAIFSSIAFFYAIFFFPRGLRKWLSAGIAVVTLMLTGARSQQAGFLLMLLLYCLVFARKPVLRWASVLAITVGGVVALVAQNLLLKYFARGQTIETLASLDDRTRIWQAAWEAIQLRPLLGYGFALGAKDTLKDHWKYTHWLPPHAHNEFIQAALEGGFIALAFILCIYGRAFWRALRDVRFGPYHLFLLLVFVQMLVNNMTGCTLTYWFGQTSGICLMCVMAALAARQDTIDGLRVADLDAVREEELAAA